MKKKKGDEDATLKAPCQSQGHSSLIESVSRLLTSSSMVSRVELGRVESPFLPIYRIVRPVDLLSPDSIWSKGRNRECMTLRDLVFRSETELTI